MTSNHRPLSTASHPHSIKPWQLSVVALTLIGSLTQLHASPETINKAEVLNQHVSGLLTPTTAASAQVNVALKSPAVMADTPTVQTDTVNPATPSEAEARQAAWASLGWIAVMDYQQPHTGRAYISGHELVLNGQRREAWTAFDEADAMGVKRDHVDDNTHQVNHIGQSAQPNSAAAASNAIKASEPAISIKTLAKPHLNHRDHDTPVESTDHSNSALSTTQTEVKPTIENTSNDTPESRPAEPETPIVNTLNHGEPMVLRLTYDCANRRIFIGNEVVFDPTTNERRVVYVNMSDGKWAAKNRHVNDPVIAKDLLDFACTIK